MLNLETLKAGRIYSFRHESEIEFKEYTLENGKRVYAPDWLHTSHVTRKAAFKGNCACPESYTNAMRKQNPDWQPSERGVWFEWTGRNGIVRHKSTGKAYLALMHPDTIKSVYFVNGIEATPAQEKEIRDWKKGKKEQSIFALFDLEEKVECEGEIQG